MAERVTGNAATPGPLVGRTLWLTRPVGQNDTLQQALQQLGARIVPLPLLQIKAVTPSLADKQKLLNLDQFDLVFYVSTNAAVIGLDAISQWWPQYPSHLLNFAVGPSTAAVLEKQGLKVYFPRTRMSSEALLELPQLHNIAGKKALIVRGKGGREIMAEGLQALGASVAYAELYERVLPDNAAALLAQALEHSQPDSIVLSSAEALDNLRMLIEPLCAQWQQLPLLLSSTRLAEHAHTVGFTRTVVIDGATDEAIIKGLLSALGVSNLQ